MSDPNRNSKKREGSILAFVSPVEKQGKRSRTGPGENRQSANTLSGQNNLNERYDLMVNCTDERHRTINNISSQITDSTENDEDNDSVDLLFEETDLNDEEIMEFTQHLTQCPSEELIDRKKDDNNDLSQIDVGQNDEDEIYDGNDFDDSDFVTSHQVGYNDISTSSSVENQFTEDQYTEEKVISDERGILIVRKRGEAFKMAYHNNTKIYVIKEILVQKKRIKCREYQSIQETFLGNSSEIKEMLEGKYDYVISQYVVEMDVKQLEQKPCERPNATNLLYNVECLNGGTNFEVTYTFMKNDNFVRENSVDSYEELFRQRVVMDLFCGAGGMSVGFERSEFHVKWAVDNDPCAIGTYALNHDKEQTTVFDEDIRGVLDEIKFASENGLTDSPYFNIKPDIIWASPPCQGFSRANRTGGKNDELNRRRTFDFKDYVDQLRPPVAAMENVTGILDKKHRIYVQKMTAYLLLMKYQVRMMILDSSNYGEAQARKRFFLFAVKQGMGLPKRPKISHDDPKMEDKAQRSIKSFLEKSENAQGKKLSQEEQKPKKTVKDVIQDLEDVKPKSGGYFILPNGTKTYNHTDQGLELKSEMEEMNENKQSRTVRAGNHFKHYLYDRTLTLRELARVQGFPDDYRFVGCKTAIRKQIGNAVPCNLAKAVADTIRHNCFPLMDPELNSKAPSKPDQQK